MKTQSAQTPIFSKAHIQFTVDFIKRDFTECISSYADTQFLFDYYQRKAFSELQGLRILVVICPEINDLVKSAQSQVHNTVFKSGGACLRLVQPSEAVEQGGSISDSVAVGQGVNNA